MEAVAVGRMSRSRNYMVAGLMFWAAALCARAGDDTFPGVSLPSSPVSGTLDYDTDWDDVYSVNLTAGQMIVASISGPTNSEYDLYLYPPGSAGFSDDYVTYAAGTTYPNRISYVAPTGKGGTYYLDAYCQSGSGSYTITYKIVTASGDDTIPGAALGSSPVTGSLNESNDIDDVYKISLSAGQVLYASISGASGSIYDLFLFGIHATDIFWTGTVASDFGESYPYKLRFTVPAGASGTYYLDAFCVSGSGSYTISYSVVTGGGDDVFPGIMLAASPVAGSVAVDSDYQDIHAVALKAGQEISVSLTGAAGTDFDLRLFEPAANNTEVDTPVAKSIGTTYPEKASYTVPIGKAGTYHVVVRAYSGSGTYTLTYKITRKNSAHNWLLYR